MQYIVLVTIYTPEGKAERAFGPFFYEAAAEWLRETGQEGRLVRMGNS